MGETIHVALGAWKYGEWADVPVVWHLGMDRRNFREVFLDKDRTLICFGQLIPGKYMPCGTMQAAGSSYSYIRHAMCGEEEVTAEKEGVSIYDVMNRLVEQSPAGAKGLVFLPYLVGERSPRWNPDAREVFSESGWSMKSVIISVPYWKG